MHLWLVALTLLVPMAVEAQPPPTGRPPASASDGKVHTLYLDLFDRTEISLDIVPRFDGDGPNPTMLRFRTSYPGRRRSTPDMIQLRAQSDLLRYPLTLRTPTLELVLDETRVVLTEAPWSYWLSYPCPDCVFDTVVVDLPLLTFARIVSAGSVSGEALGFPFAFDEADRRALLDFASAFMPR